jgi:DNA-directed RNA polymerase subunit RPC12/RpoP
VSDLPKPSVPDVRFANCDGCLAQMTGVRLDMPHSHTKRYEYHCHDCGRTWLQDNDEQLRERFPGGASCTEHDYRLYYLSTTMAVPAGARSYRRSHSNYGCLKCGRMYEVGDDKQIIAEIPAEKASFHWMQLWRTARR